MTATPVTDSAALAHGSRSSEVASPSSPSASCRARIERGSFLRGSRCAATSGSLVSLAMPVVGVHGLFYTSEPKALRAVLRDVFGWDHVDAHGGWLIFALPADAPRHELTFMCRDIQATVAELRERGVEVLGEPEDLGFGGVGTRIVLPGGVEVLVYEATHPSPWPA